MRQGNHSNARWALVVAALVVLISGSMVLGSNMGFKFNMPLPAQTGLTPQGVNIMSIPYLVPYADMQCLCDQLGLTGSAVVQQFVGASGAFTTPYLCGLSTCGSAPALDTSLGFYLTDSASSGSAIVVGAHDPSKVVQLACNTGLLPQGDNWVSIPYHSTAGFRQDICNEIPAALAISEFDGGSGAFNGATYICNVSPVDTAITKGRALKIVLDGASAECTGAGFANWVPNHF